MIEDAKNEDKLMGAKSTTPPRFQHRCVRSCVIAVRMVSGWCAPNNCVPYQRHALTAFAVAPSMHASFFSVLEWVC